MGLPSGVSWSYCPSGLLTWTFHLAFPAQRPHPSFRKLALINLVVIPLSSQIQGSLLQLCR